MTQKMADAGADAVLVITPYYFKGRMTNAALQEHFLKVRLYFFVGKHIPRPPFKKKLFPVERPGGNKCAGWGLFFLIFDFFF